MARLSITYSPEFARKFIKRLKELGSYAAAARAFGIPSPTIRNWLRKFPDFREECQRVIAELDKQ